MRHHLFIYMFQTNAELNLHARTGTTYYIKPADCSALPQSWLYKAPPMRASSAPPHMKAPHALHCGCMKAPSCRARGLAFIKKEVRWEPDDSLRTFLSCYLIGSLRSPQQGTKVNGKSFRAEQFQRPLVSVPVVILFQHLMEHRTALRNKSKQCHA